MAPLATIPGVTAEAIFRSRAVINPLMSVADFSASAACPVTFWSVCVSNPLATLVWCLAKKHFQIDRGGCAVPLDRLNSDRRTGGDMKLEAHDGLVDAANLLDGKSSITDALAIEQHEF